MDFGDKAICAGEGWAIDKPAAVLSCQLLVQGSAFGDRRVVELGVALLGEVGARVVSACQVSLLSAVVISGQQGLLSRAVGGQW